MITYTSDNPSGITINGRELEKGDVVKEPRSLVDFLRTRDGWGESKPIAKIKPRKRVAESED